MDDHDRRQVHDEVHGAAEAVLSDLEERWETVPRVGPIRVSQFPGEERPFPPSAEAFFEDFYPCAAGAVVTDDTGRLLCVHSPKREDWETPGGVVDPGEVPAETARRETREESGIECELTGVLFARLMEVTYDVSETLPIPVVVFTADRVGGSELDGEDLSANEEVTDVAWFEPDEIPTDLREYERKHEHVVEQWSSR